MFFVLSKTLSLVLEPLVHPFLLLIIALLAKWRRRRRLQRALVVFAVGLPLLYGFLPFSQAGLMLLENRFPIPTMDERPIDGVIILDGHTGSGFVSQQRGQPQQNRSAERLIMGLKLHRQYPDVPLLFSGFSGKLFHQGWGNADIIRRLLSDLSVPLGRVQFEETSRNTYENAVNSRQLLLPQPGSRWILVTSAAHMPRSIGSFEAAGWTGIIPYPVDYTTGTDFEKLYSLQQGFGSMRQTLHEIAGLVVYRLTGRSNQLLPRAKGN
jgi:uncharacterized SAM-binding protein YcdF (DUF218 family)